ncbi:DUF262 domain-containing protein [Brachyspira alvinipulli]|uniref:DUF262 domain-containing protein n=1 Tax=Brachyspira alvinipulli TaxID=84379 RepID=UPI0004AFDCDE|nr:DUF262 domain-containing protein [Brachyspira alvinipulli]
MMMNEKLSLRNFFKKYSRIEIPKIQRDYAQGRENESEVADRFLNKIFECLKEDNKKLELDFIYGSVDKNNVVYLLDGQQRVTTLFLLYWYIALREDRFNEEIKECFKKFTYSTRVSSREFCKNIINNIEKIKKYYDNKIVENKKVELSNIITDFYWFTNENDPTIKAMLNMIDKIDEKYNEITKDNNSIKLFDNLEKIQFYFLPLEDFKLTDEIYLKMNARGKPLTSFENFKALLEDFFKDKINNDILQQYKIKIDTSWVNFIWTLTNDYKKVDSLFMKLFSFIFEMIYYSQIEIVEDTRKLQIEKSNLEFFELFFSHIGDEKKEYIKKLKANPIENELDKKTALKNNIEFIINIFDILSELGKDNLNILFNKIFYYSESENNNEDKYEKISTFYDNLNVFYDDNDDNLFEFTNSIGKSILIFAIFKILNYEYLKNEKNIKDINNIRNKYFNKLRLIRNLLYNTYNLYDNIYYQMKLIDKIITEDEFEVINTQLSNKDSIKNTLFTKDLVNSEKNKLDKLKKNNENINKNIYACENNIFLQGNIDFLLGNIDNENIVDVVNYIFTKDGFNNENGNYLIHRAMLSFIDIENIMKGCKEYKYKYHIYTEYIFKNYKLWDNRKNDKERFINFIKTISKKINDKNIEDSIKENCQNIIDNTENYIKKDENDFRYLLIKDATYGNDNITNLFHYISGTIKWKGNRGYYLYYNGTKQSILDIPLTTKVHTMFHQFLQKHTDFKLYYFDGSNNPKIEESRILKYSNNEFLYCYEWITLAKEIEIADETVLVGFTTDGYCIECGIRKYDFNVSEKKINEINKKINNDILCKLNQYRNDSGAYYYWKYLDTCNDKILDDEYKKILKSVIDAFSTK